MLEPREADIPALFFLLVVLPLVAYILLGKWSETAERRERISLLAQLAAEEASKAELMAVPVVLSLVSPSKNRSQVCAKCSAPARTRCSRCKSVRYCSGNCQIIHWRQEHKDECQQVGSYLPSFSSLDMPMEERNHHSGLLYDNVKYEYYGNMTKEGLTEETARANLVWSQMGPESAVTDVSSSSLPEVPMSARQKTRKHSRHPLRGENGNTNHSSAEFSAFKAFDSTSSYTVPSNVRQKPKSTDQRISRDEISEQPKVTNSSVHTYKEASSKVNMHDLYMYGGQCAKAFLPRNSQTVTKKELVHEYDIEGEKKLEKTFLNELVQPINTPELAPTLHKLGCKSLLHPARTKESKAVKLTIKEKGDSYLAEQKAQSYDEKEVARVRGYVPEQRSAAVAGTGISKMMGLRKSTEVRSKVAKGIHGYRPKKLKMLFPYEEFVKLFQAEVFDISPRGLVNCGNSCYANAVLQCLTCTKPLVVYLLVRFHSKSCFGKECCLMCELEQYIAMLKEDGPALSPSRILVHVQSINCQMVDGNQEDAHEFLRLLIASMQSICLEALGGENNVDPLLQETTFIQHIFGGRLKSKVKCLRCNHESERYENIMDLTLEIYGRVESLEDALTEFTNPEDLDGENMYRCARCASYVQARKQLSIHEAPNILTIVLKRFQEGRYGKINKCISFPDMLDMVPFMTGTGDIPSLYMLYAVVVHLDMQNASFSGHYVSYVKDMRGCWFRIDDTEVQPVSISQVMSEGAYILFYMRSYPRPQMSCTDKASEQQFPEILRQCTNPQKPSRSAHRRQGSQHVRPDLRPDCDTASYNEILRNSTNRNSLPEMETYAEPIGKEFSDATASEWSLFTSSDEASFTTESRDSFSTVDYGDIFNIDPLSSTFSRATEYPRNSISCRKFNKSRLLTRFFTEKDQTLNSYLSSSAPNRAIRKPLQLPWHVHKPLE